MLIQDRANQSININESDNDSTVLTMLNLNRLSNCTIEISLQTTPLCICVDAMTKCRVIFKHPVLLNQFRIHSCSDSVFEINSDKAGSIILENCNRLRFYSHHAEKISIFDFSDPLGLCRNYELFGFANLFLENKI